MHRGFLISGILLSALSVALGAFAAHGLKQTVSASALEIFETSVRYQFYHSFALIITGILFSVAKPGVTKWAGYLFVAGIILFSGSLYALTFIKASAISGYNWVGAITPFGGLCFILGWIFLAIGIWNINKGKL